MRRLSALLFHNNYISRINESVGTALSSLNTLILTNNRIVSLAEIDNIAKLKQLQVLSLLDNPVISRPNYRLYTIFKIPTLKVLDFQKVKKKEREEASAFFASDVGKAYMTAIAQESRNNNSNGTRPVMMLTDEQKALVKAAIEAATTKDDIDRIEKQLKVSIEKGIRHFEDYCAELYFTQCRHYFLGRNISVSEYK